MKKELLHENQELLPKALLAGRGFNRILSAASLLQALAGATIGASPEGSMMSFEAMDWLRKHSVARHADRLVLWELAWHADKAGGNAYASCETLAEEARVSVRQVKQSLSALEALGEIHVEATSPRGVRSWAFTGMQCNICTGEKSAPVQNPANPGAESVAAIAPPNTPHKDEKSLKVSMPRPTEAEVAAYFEEIGLPVAEAAAFVDHHKQKGWLIGASKTPMKDWRAAGRTWKRNFDSGVFRPHRNGNGKPRRDETPEERNARVREELSHGNS